MDWRRARQAGREQGAKAPAAQAGRGNVPRQCKACTRAGRQALCQAGPRPRVSQQPRREPPGAHRWNMYLSGVVSRCSSRWWNACCATYARRRLGWRHTWLPVSGLCSPVMIWVFWAGGGGGGGGGSQGGSNQGAGTLGVAALPPPDSRCSPLLAAPSPPQPPAAAPAPRTLMSVDLPAPLTPSTATRLERRHMRWTSEIWGRGAPGYVNDTLSSCGGWGGCAGRAGWAGSQQRRGRAARTAGRDAEHSPFLSSPHTPEALHQESTPLSPPYFNDGLLLGGDAVQQPRRGEAEAQRGRLQLVVRLGGGHGLDKLRQVAAVAAQLAVLVVDDVFEGGECGGVRW
jgi:hypothetical protein